MELVAFLIDFILHVDVHLRAFVEAYGTWVYALLFLIIFVETGVVVMPFLPGDSLLFVAGALAGAGMMDYSVLVPLLIVAAIAGDQTNYAIGRLVGPRVFGWEQSLLFNRAAFDRAHAFYERYGGITIVLARFLPFLRTFAPFVAGVAQMTRRVTAGYLFGNISWVQANLSKIIWALILIPGLIALYGGWRARRSAAA
ncbi:MAG: VTT domain-containing protein, partial [Burkholderiaceae bacterium]|nr:VTT domain-containing protein [Burkholderiaceae bacterium]